MGRWLGRGARAGLLDLGLLLAVVALLAGVHVLLPPGVRDGLALRYANPDPLHALTAAAVHLDGAHLVGNLAGFVLAAGVAAVLAGLVGERRWFRLSFLATLTVLPVVVGMTAAAVVGGAVVGRGFSSVVAGFVGVVLASPGVVLPRAHGFDRRVGWTVVAALVVVVGAEILWVVGAGIAPAVGAGLAAGFLVVLAPLARRAADRSAWPADRDAWVDLAGATVTVGVVLAVVSGFVVGLFPADVVGPDRVTNVLGHYLGLVCGTVIAAWGARYWASPPPSPVEPSELSGPTG